MKQLTSDISSRMDESGTPLTEEQLENLANALDELSLSRELAGWTWQKMGHVMFTTNAQDALIVDEIADSWGTKVRPLFYGSKKDESVYSAKNMSIAKGVSRLN